MPYYRIVIWVENESSRKEGIKYLENGNIDAVQNLMRSKAREHYGRKLKDIEVQMLAKGCSAVIKYREQVRKKREDKKRWGDQKPSQSTGNTYESRRDYYARQERLPLGERPRE